MSSRPRRSKKVGDEIEEMRLADKKNSSMSEAYLEDLLDTLDRAFDSWTEDQLEVIKDG